MTTFALLGIGIGTLGWGLYHFYFMGMDIWDRWKDSGSGSGSGEGDNPYNIDPDDPQDYWKKENGKAFE